MSLSRTCTILFTDLVGSTELRTRLGDDRFDVRRRAHDQLIAESVERHHGEVVKFGGDGVMAVFAAAADALSCAVVIQQGLARDRSDEERLEVRMGLSAGDVVEESDDFHGTPVVEAARLCSVAGGGQVLAADVVRVLAGTRGDHRFLPMGALELKGLPEPLVAWEIPWAVERENLMAVPARLAEVTARGRCMGRDEEIATLVDAWKRVVTGERRLVLVAGEPGIGKTRLASELASRVVDHGGVALHGWCDEDLSSPYQPWAQALGAYVRAVPDNAVERHTAGIATDLTKLVPELVDRVPDPGGTSATDPEAEQSRLFDAVDVLLARMGAEHPVLVVLDDLHWADRPTLALLRRLLVSDRAGSVMFLATYRDTDVDRRHPLAEVLADFRRETRVERVSLSGLDEVGLGAMLTDRAGHDAPAAFVRVLFEETEGNPFFVEEVLLHLVETGGIYQRDGVWVTDTDPADLGLPEGVRDVVGRRLSRLSSEANDLLTIAAVVGRDWDLAAVIAAGGIERDAALDALDAALSSGLVTEMPQTAGEYSFSHALVRQTLLEEISSARRARLHWKIGEVLGARSGSSLAAVAFHLCEGVLAGDVTEAAGAAIAAAEAAYEVGAPDEARTLAERALGVLDDAHVDEPEIRCRALLAIGEAASRLQQDFEAARAWVVEAATIARAIESAELAIRAAAIYSALRTFGAIDPVANDLALAALDLGASEQERPRLLALVGYTEITLGNWDHGSPLIDEAVAAAEPYGGIGLVTALGYRAFSDQGSSDLDQRTATDRRALDAAESLGIAQWMSLARQVGATTSLASGDRAAVERERDMIAGLWGRGTAPPLAVIDGCIALMDGRFGDAEHNALECLASVDPVSPTAAGFTGQLAATWYWSGRDDELLGAMDVFPSGAPATRYLVDSVRASTHARRGERDERLNALVADAFGGMPRDGNRVGSLCHVGSAAAWLEDRDLAAQLVPLLEQYAGQLLVANGPSIVFEAADSVRGMLLLVLDQVDEAIACHEAAVVLCERVRCVPHSIMNQHRLARALARRNEPGDRERARQLATDALERATEFGLAPDVRFAQAVLDALP